MIKKNIIIEAHRGASGYELQNTMESFKKALEFKADAIELDVRRTKDNKIIVVHDPMYLEVLINDWIYQELIEKTLQEGFIMPLLSDVLKEFKGKIIIDIEIKEEGYEKEILDLITSILLLNEFQIRSFSEKTIKTIKELNKDVYAILLIGEKNPRYGLLGRISEVFPNKRIKRSLCDAVSPNYHLLIFGFVRRMHKQNKKVFVWTVNKKNTIKKLINKVDGIVTDYPDIALSLKKENK